jgi:small-conductance mechanosensitive channel
MSLGSCPEQLKDASHDVEKIKEYLHEFSKNLDLTGQNFCPGETDGSQILRVVLIFLLTINCIYLISAILTCFSYFTKGLFLCVVSSVFIWFYSSTINLLEKASRCELEDEEESEELVTRIEACVGIQLVIPVLIAVLLLLSLIMSPLIWYLYEKKSKDQKSNTFGFSNEEEDLNVSISGILTGILGWPIFIILVNALNHRDKWIDIYKSPVFIKS